MKKTLSFLLFSVPFMLILCSCDKSTDEGSHPELCDGYTYQTGGRSWDTLKYTPMSNGDSIENGYRVYRVKVMSDKPTCYNDSLTVAIVAGLEENQPRPIIVRAYLELDYIDHNNHYAEYITPIPLVNNNEMWSSEVGNGSNHWRFLPKPYVEGTNSEYFTTILDFLVPVNGNSGADWLYLCNMSTGLIIDYIYLATNF